ncbi:hypothetical protein HPB47_003824 [Ixodes persulcatus]|uniref:Uncharacterized protein n=1 Tax=Ixodes persulcatus TaxID=34615 RepID=A0AC60PIE2_IXOPE|nr:hypothetical protein HPB47_003824 [Ixodes persulcatus]
MRRPRYPSRPRAKPATRRFRGPSGSTSGRGLPGLIYGTRAAVGKLADLGLAVPVRPVNKSLRLWDPRSPNGQGVMHLTGRPVGKFDPEGYLRRAALLGAGRALRPARLRQGPLQHVQAAPGQGVRLKGAVIHLIDAFQAVPQQSLHGTHEPQLKAVPLDASFSPDSQFVFSGSTDGRVHPVDHCGGGGGGGGGGLRTAVLNCDHTGPVHCVQFNPKYVMLVAACWTIWATTWP